MPAAPTIMNARMVAVVAGVAVLIALLAESYCAAVGFAYA
jgi:hypothetical protein